MRNPKACLTRSIFRFESRIVVNSIFTLKNFSSKNFFVLNKNFPITDIQST